SITVTIASETATISSVTGNLSEADLELLRQTAKLLAWYEGRYRESRQVDGLYVIEYPSTERALAIYEAATGKQCDGQWWKWEANAPKPHYWPLRLRGNEIHAGSPEDIALVDTYLQFGHTFVERAVRAP